MSKTKALRNAAILLRHQTGDQYHGVYLARYHALAAYFQPDEPRLDHIPKTNDRVFSVVASLYVSFAKRDTIIMRFKNTDVIKWQDDDTIALQHDAKQDAYFLEDPSDHIAIQSPNAWNVSDTVRQRILTGMIACFTLQLSNELSPEGVYRYAVKKLVLPGTCSPGGGVKPKPAQPHLVCLSDVRLDSEGRSPLERMLAKPLPNTVCGLVIVGPFVQGLPPQRDDVIPEVVQNGRILTYEERNAEHKMAQMRQHQRALQALAARGLRVFLVPASTDLTGYRLPQPPLHRLVLGLNNTTTSIHSKSNPVVLTPHGRQVHISSGQGVRAVRSCSPHLKKTRDILEAMLHWRHLAPCIPDFYACAPTTDTDPLLLPKTLDWLIVGAEALQKNEQTGILVTPEETRAGLLALPSFTHTQTYAVLNLHTQQSVWRQATSTSR